MSNKGSQTIIPIDDEYAISFPMDEDIITEHEDGSMSIITEVYRLVDGKKVKIENGTITPEIHAKIEAFVNEMLTQAIEFEKYEKRLKK